MTLALSQNTPPHTSTVSIGRPELRVAVAGDAAAQDFSIVVRRDTLREARRARSLLRAGSHDPANFAVALEIEVAIAPQAASARASIAADVVTPEVSRDERSGATIRYVGTPRGLESLIRDVYAAEVADAVIVNPIDGSATAGRIRAEVLPRFT